MPLPLFICSRCVYECRVHRLTHSPCLVYDRLGAHFSREDRQRTRTASPLLRTELPLHPLFCSHETFYFSPFHSPRLISRTPSSSVSFFSSETERQLRIYQNGVYTRDLEKFYSLGKSVGPLFSVSLWMLIYDGVTSIPAFASFRFQTETERRDTCVRLFVSFAVQFSRLFSNDLSVPMSLGVMIASGLKILVHRGRWMKRKSRYCQPVCPV